MLQHCHCSWANLHQSGIPQRCVSTSNSTQLSVQRFYWVFFISVSLLFSEITYVMHQMQNASLTSISPRLVSISMVLKQEEITLGNNEMRTQRRACHVSPEIAWKSSHSLAYKSSLFKRYLFDEDAIVALNHSTVIIKQALGWKSESN